MQLKDYEFQLPDELIAQHPLAQRSASRMLCVAKHGDEVSHQQVKDLPQWLKPGDLLVFNDTQVIPARLWGQKASGGKVEILVERILNSHQVLAHVRASKAPKPDSLIIISERLSLKVLGREQELFQLEFLSPEPVLQLLEAYGHTPLPPYIARDDELGDKERYQTVYAAVPGAVAAPTAGLHFDQPLLNQFKDRGVNSAYVTLHVGAGTFQPVRCETITEHQMHAEWVEVSSTVIEQIKETKAKGHRVIAIGTTSVRALETAANAKLYASYCGESRLFIYPGSPFHYVDALFTNFHLPRSSLLMLVSALGGYDTIMRSYQIAIESKYRFYSYGDAMFIY